MQMHSSYQEADSGSANPYVIISGNGRSGSNRLLNIFDVSPSTVCRSEVYSARGGDFFSFGRRLFDDSELDVHALRSAFRRASLRRGHLDRFDQANKDYFNYIGRSMLPLMSKKRVRHLWEAAGLMQNASEWAFPKIGLKKKNIRNAVLVVKLNASPAWTEAMLKFDGNCSVVHNVRDPYAYLASWFNRFVKKEDDFGRSFERNFEDVSRILLFFERHDAERLRTKTLENMVEVEMWRWRYINEKIFSLASFEGRYMRVTYSELDADPLSAARSMFNFAGLEMCEGAEARVLRMRNKLFSEPHSAILDHSLCARVIESVLDGSPLARFTR